MRRDASWRSRAVSLARHAAAAAGLGLAWLVVSGSPAFASDGPLGDAAGSAVSVVGQTLQAAPEALAPVTGSPVLAPAVAALSPVPDPGVEPLVAGTAEALGGGVADVGAAVGDVADDGALQLPPPLPLPVFLGPVPEPAEPPAPATAADAPASRLADAPAGSEQQEAPAVGRPPAAVSGVQSAVAGFLPTVAAAVQAVHAALSTADLPLPLDGQLLAPVLPPAPGPGSLGGPSSGPGGGPVGAVALAAGSFCLALLMRRGQKLRPASVPLPVSPVFDPGSTPD